MELALPTISAKLEEAITSLIENKPEVFAEVQDPRGLAGAYLARHNPEVFDSSNPVDTLLLKLESFEPTPLL